MKEIANFGGGALIISEQGGDIYLALDGKVGGGMLAGIVEGQAKIKLGAGSVGLKAAEAYVNHLLPDMVQPYAKAAEAYLNGAIAGL